MSKKQHEAVEIIKKIQDALITTHPELIVRGLIDKKAREELKLVVKKEHAPIVRGNEELVDLIVRETVGTGVIEEIIENNEDVTDIGYNGRKLIYEGSDFREVYDDTNGQKIDDNYIVRIVQKFANAVGKDFTPKEPILDAVFGTVRLNAVHKSRSGQVPPVTTMSMRLVRPRLALNEQNFINFAPKYILDFFKIAVQAKSNITIAGETGTGKTELQKLLMSYIDIWDKIILIEDVPETHATSLFPDKDIYTWVTSEGTTITDLVKAALRNNPRWILVTETRGSESYELIQSVLSGHKIITSLHAITARAIPRRMARMAKMGYNISEKDLEEDIKRYFDLGILIERKNYNGKVVRYLKEVVEFGVDEDITVFKQKFKNGVFETQAGRISDELLEKLHDVDETYVFPENKKEVRDLKEV